MSSFIWFGIGMIYLAIMVLVNVFLEKDEENPNIL